MHVRTLALATACGAAFLAAAAAPAPPATAAGGQAPPRPVRAKAVGAADLLAKTRGCDRISRGKYRKDAGAKATVPVCGAAGAVYWKADLDIACDGRKTARCNRKTDPWFLSETAFRQSDGKALDAARLPYVVVPVPSTIWKYPDSGIRGGGVVAVVHGNRVRYGVVGDTGPAKIVGEASYAMAESLGIDPDPVSGGVSGGVTYIFFTRSRATPIESRAAATRLGQNLARSFVAAN
ncbi:glycoside hydrolase family 75 protein [Streptomyces sp. NPDC094448]|uniref:glycoside hydrolase family 75 protein n=1 Tax=Streptomyces sp. NPDC094448 TaxID=3366063 RepID=UPI0038118D92